MELREKTLRKNNPNYDEIFKIAYQEGYDEGYYHGSVDQEGCE